MRRALAGLLAVLALTGCTALRHAAAASPGARPRASAPPPSPAPAGGNAGFYLGVRAQGFPPSWAAVQDFSTAVGQRPRLVLFYSGWNEAFPRRLAGLVAAHGMTPLIQLNPQNVPLAAIAAGRDDRYLRAYAAAVRMYRGTVVIGFAHEMNGSWYPWGYGHTSPAVWVRAWQHVVTVFRAAGASNVTWLWTASAGSDVPGRLRLYWPGSRYVTWVGIDGYYYTPAKRFTRIFVPAITEIRSFTHDPILLSETAIGPGAGQAQMIPNLFAGIRRFHLLGLVWYDVAQHDGRYHQDWRLEGNPAAIAAFRRGLAAIGAG
jgi:hypothetical protein